MKSVFFALLLFLPVLLKAQSNYRKGYVVTITGDTLAGFIDFKEWNRNPEAINFKAKTESEAYQKFTPANCNYFEVTGLEAYQQYKVRISLDEVVFAKLSTGIDTSSKTNAVFLKVLQKGEHVGLFSYRDHIKTRFYLLQQDQNRPEELIYRIYHRAPEPQEQNTKNAFTVRSMLYAGQLWLAANKYKVASPELKQQIEQADYSEADLLKIVSKINGISKNNLKQSSSGYARTRFFAGVGVNRSAATLTRNNILTYYTVWDEQNTIDLVKYVPKKENQSYRPKINVGVDFFPFPKTQRLMFRNTLSLAMADFKFSNTINLKYPDRQVLYELTCRQLITSVSSELIYHVYNAENIKFYLGVGAAYNVIYYPKNRLYAQTLTAGANKEETTTDNYLPAEKNWVNLPLRAGVVLPKNIDLSIIYWPHTRLVLGNELLIKANYIYFEVNYLFNKKLLKS